MRTHARKTCFFLSAERIVRRENSTSIPTCTEQTERTRSLGRSQARIAYMRTNDLRLQYRKHEATSGPAFIIERKAPSDLTRLKRMVPPQIRTETEVRPDILPPRNTLAENAFADPCPRARPIPICPDHMQVGEELVRWHTFALPSLVCSRAHVPHIHAQPIHVRGTVLVATITTRIASLIPPTIHTCSCATTARTIARVP